MADRGRLNPYRAKLWGTVIESPWHHRAGPLPSGSVLLCPPTYFEVIDTKNPYMIGTNRVEKWKAIEQWRALGRALEMAGMKVETIEPVPGLEDMVFAANQVFVGSHDQIGKFVVPSRMRHPSRQREVPFYVQWFRNRGYKIMEIDLGDECLEGSGDLIWHPGTTPTSLEPGNRCLICRIYAGYGFRSTVGGIRRFTAAMEQLSIAVVPLELVDPSFYHLDTCFCPLNQDATLIYPGAFTSASLDAVRPFWRRLHEITEAEAKGFMANGIVAGEYYLTPRLTPNLERILIQEKLRPVVVDTSEFEKSGGSCFCMKSFIE